MEEWASFSNCHLGDIWIENDDNISRMIVMLMCTYSAKRSVVTTINPNCYDICISSYDMLEVILFEENFGYANWNWEWRPASGVNAYLKEMRKISFIINLP